MAGDIRVEQELADYPRTGRFMINRVRDQLSREERQVLEDAVVREETFDRSHRILERGKVYNQSTMLIDGFVLRTIDGHDRRHTVSVHVPGDFIDLHCFALKRLDHNLDTIGPVRLGYVPHDRLQDIMVGLPHLARILWYATLVDAAIHREWVMKLEQLTTARRLAHIFAETWRRLHMVALGDADGFDTPIRQSDLAEMTGATTVHVNRALRELREADIAHYSRGRIDIPDRDRLEDYARFSPRYLYGNGPGDGANFGSGAKSEDEI